MTEQAFDPREKYQSQIPALQLLVALGYTPLSSAEALRLRGGKARDVILHDVLIEQLVRLNTFTHRSRTLPFDVEDAENALRALVPVGPGGLLTTNRDTYDNLLLGATVVKTIDGHSRSYSMDYIDWKHPENNVFHVTAEYRVDRAGGASSDRLDVVAFVNGIPLVVIENKRPSQPVRKAEHDLIRYQGDSRIPHLFHTAALLIAANGTDARYGTVGTQRQFWARWRERDNDDAAVATAANAELTEAQRDALFSGAFADARGYFAESEASGPRLATEQDRALYALCRPQRLLEIVRTFTVFDARARKVARHQQYFAVKLALERVTASKDDAPRAGGVIWHTQGSGKSLTMVMLGKALALDDRIPNPRIVLVTDRDDLDKQIQNTFRACRMEPKRATSGRDLTELIRGHAPLITTIVNKFETATAAGAERDDDPNVFVLVDESHRSQSAQRGDFGTFAKAMRRMLPNAAYIGFTGTPLLGRERNTYRTFGRSIHTYTIEDALADEAIVPLLYEGRKVDQYITKEAIDSWFERITSDLTPEQRRDLKRKFSRAEVIAGAGQVIRAKAFDISEHYRQHWQGTGFTAQLVAPDKAAAIRFKAVFDEIGHVTSEVLISAPGDDEDPEAVDRESRVVVQRFWDDAMARYGSESRYNAQVIEAFKSGDTEILIVVSKLLTGFDSPRNTVLYLCRRLYEHTLLQAIARVNRLYEDEARTKEFGYIIDYEGLLGELDQALTTYAALDGFDEDELIDAVVPVRAEIDRLQSRWSAVWSLFDGVSRRDREALEVHLGDEERRQDFYARLAAFTRTLHTALSSVQVDDLVAPERLKQYKTDWKSFTDLRRAVQLRYLERVDLRDYESKIQKLLDDHLIAMLPEVHIPELNLNNPAELKAVVAERGISTASKADRIATATRKRITDRMAQDPALYQRFSEMLQLAIDEYRQRRENELEYVEKFAKDYLDAVTDLAQRVASGERGRDLPGTISHDPDAPSVFEQIHRSFVGLVAGSPLADDETVAEIALGLIDIVRDRLIVNVWQNESRVTEIENALDDYLLDEVESARGIPLGHDDEDAIREAVLSIARARFP